MAILQMQRKEYDEMPKFPPFFKSQYPVLFLQNHHTQVFLPYFCRKRFYLETNTKHTIYALVNNSALNTGNLLRE